jgi:hypothetical protein
MKLTIKSNNNDDITEQFSGYLQSLKENDVAIFQGDIMLANDTTCFKVINIIVSPKRNEVIVLVSRMVNHG